DGIRGRNVTGVQTCALPICAGALVFGGGHVVLPLLETETVGAGLVDADTFLAGYGAAQAVPGPLFTFASFLGTSSTGELTGIVEIGRASCREEGGVLGSDQW